MSHDLNSPFCVKPAFFTSNSVVQSVHFPFVVIEAMTRKWTGVWSKWPPGREEKPIFAKDCASLKRNQMETGKGSSELLAQKRSGPPKKASFAEKRQYRDEARASPSYWIKRRAENEYETCTSHGFVMAKLYHISLIKCGALSHKKMNN